MIFSSSPWCFSVTRDHETVSCAVSKDSIVCVWRMSSPGNVVDLKILVNLARLGANRYRITAGSPRGRTQSRVWGTRQFLGVFGVRGGWIRQWGRPLQLAATPQRWCCTACFIDCQQRIRSSRWTEADFITQIWQNLQDMTIAIKPAFQNSKIPTDGRVKRVRRA